MIAPRHKFESRWEVGVIKTFDKKGPHASKFSVKYKDDFLFCYFIEVTYDCSEVC